MPKSQPKPEPVLRIHPADTLLVALQDLHAGQAVTIAADSWRVNEDIPAKHKFAARDFAPGDPVHLFGVVVGKATQPIRAGDLVHTHNLSHAAEPFGLSFKRPYAWTAPDVSRFKDRRFLGYRRADGRVGTRNHWLVIPLVFCENNNLQVMREAFLRELGYADNDCYAALVRELVAAREQGRDPRSVPSPNAASAGYFRPFPNVDGIKFLTHTLGCGGVESDSVALCRLLAAYVCHPNVAGATVLSLGCQKAQIAMLQDEIRRIDPAFSKPLPVLESQKIGLKTGMLEEAIRATFEGLVEADECRTVGVKCGASDGFSGISANPAVGLMADKMVALGGASVLAEFPELVGVEQELIDRCVSDDLAQKFIDLMGGYAAQAAACGASMDMNPSPGNIRDGLITDAIKSCGAARKGGYAPVVDVLDYPEQARKNGLHLLCTPGNDVEATTGQAAAGCNLILFTTGLGTPTGNPITPTLKIATNHALASKMPDIIDHDCGGVIDGRSTLELEADALLELCIRVASGQQLARAEVYNQDDFIPWKRGVSL
ncbi:MAG: altronate dehydratase [Verrucomicrobia bacterium]|nr:altronate dehydratase [Verrucomicrobiota bacterium]